MRPAATVEVIGPSQSADRPLPGWGRSVTVKLPEYSPRSLSTAAISVEPQRTTHKPFADRAQAHHFCQGRIQVWDGFNQFGLEVVHLSVEPIAATAAGTELEPTQAFALEALNVLIRFWHRQPQGLDGVAGFHRCAQRVIDGVIHCGGIGNSSGKLPSKVVLERAILSSKVRDLLGRYRVKSGPDSRTQRISPDQ